MPCPSHAALECVCQSQCMLQIANERAGCAGIDEGKGAGERERGLLGGG